MTAPRTGTSRLEGVIEASWLAALLVTPLVLAPHHALAFDRPKAAFVLACGLLGSFAWAARVLGGAPPWLPLSTSDAARGAVRRLVLGLGLGVLSLGISSALALAPRLAVLGTDARAMGAATRLSILALCGLALSRLRTRAQVLRLLEVVALSSLPVCLYALLQVFGNDPIFPIRQIDRPFSTLGNATILGRLLVSALLLTVALLVERSTEESQRGLWAGARQGLLVGLVGLQSWTLLASGSRGPLLGLLAGATAALAAVWALRRGGGSPLEGVDRSLLAVVGLALLVFTGLGWHQASSRPAGGASLARGVTGLVDAGSRTAHVRFELWRAAAAAFTAERPLPGASGADALHALRPWIGHGPGLAGPPLARAAREELASLEPGRTPDQAHNRLWELLLTGGLLAAAAWVLVQGALLEVLFAGLGLLRHPGDGPRLWAGLGSGALAGALGAALLRPGSGLWVPAAAAGALLAVAVVGLLLARRGGVDAPSPPQARLMILVGGAFVARLVASQFGVETVTDLLGTAMLVPLLAVAAGGLPEDRDTSGGLPEDRDTSYRSGRLSENRDTSGRSGWLPAAAAGTALVLCWGLAAARHTALGPEPPGPGRLLPVLWCTGVVVLCAALLGERSRAWRVPVAAAGALGAALVLQRLGGAWLAQRVAAAGRHWTEASGQFEIVLAAATLLGLVAGAALCGATSLAPSEGAPGEGAPGEGTAGGETPTGAASARRGRFALAAIPAALLAACALWTAGLGPLRTGFLLRAAERARAAGESAVALTLAEAALRHAADPGRAATLLASIERLGDGAAVAEAHPDRHDRARTALQRALAASPFDSDLLGNLGLLDLEAAGRAEGPRRRELASQATTRLEGALALRPYGGPWGRHLARARLLAAAGDLPVP